MVVLDDIVDKYFNAQNIKHAYLLETSDYNKVLTIAKKILLEFNSKIHNIDVLVEKGICSDLKIIEPDGQWIKKEQIINLKDEFKVKSSFNNKRVYVIKNAENLNKSSANTMLKFLEEPEENIIALLVTENKTKVLETIVSRCQYIILDSNNDQPQQYSENSIHLYQILEEKKQNASAEIIKLFEEICEKNKIKKILNELIYIYEQILLKKIHINVSEKYNKIFDKTVESNTIDDIQRKINGIIFVIDSLEYNVNLKLLVDKLVILMFGVD